MAKNINELTLKKESNFYQIFLNDEFLGRLHKKNISALNLKPDNLQSCENVTKIIKLIQKSTFKKALQILARQDYSKQELIRKLEKTSNLKIINQVVEKLKNLNFINDYNYALNLARKLMVEKCFGKTLATFKMKSKGIDSITIKKAIDNLNLDMTQPIIKIIKKKFNDKINNSNNFTAKQKIIRYLIQKGHSYNNIKNAMNYFENEKN